MSATPPDCHSGNGVLLRAGSQVYARYGEQDKFSAATIVVVGGTKATSSIVWDDGGWAGG